MNINKMQLPEKINTITHPYIADIFLKHDVGPYHEDVLVIETYKTTPRHNDDTEHDAFDSYVFDLLMDLEDLKHKAESEIGHFDRIDIRH